jgi:hypothetical protein
MLKEQLFLIEDSETGSVYKTQFGVNLINLKTTINLTTKNLLCYIYSRVYNCQNDILKILAMLSTVRSSKELASVEIVKGKITVHFDQLKQIYGNCFGESVALLKIANDIIKFFTIDLPKSNNMPTLNLEKMLNMTRSTFSREKLQIQKNKFLKSVKNSSKDYSDIDSILLDKFIQLYSTDNFSSTSEISDKEIDSFISSGTYIREIVRSSVEDEQKVKEWCKIRYLDFDKVTKFYKIYLELLNGVIKYERKDYDVDLEIVDEKNVDLTWFNTHTPKMINSDDKQLNITVSLMSGYYYNIARNIAIINDNYFYINIFNPTLRYVNKIGKTFRPKYETKKRFENDTFIKKDCLRSTILYMTKKESDDYPGEDIFLIENIPSSLIAKITPQILFFDKNQRYSTTEHQAHVRDYLNKITIFKKDTVLHLDIINNYVKTVQSIKYDLYNNINKNFIDKIVVVDEDPNKKSILRHKEIKNLLGGKKDICDVNKINNEYLHVLIKLLNS